LKKSVSEGFCRFACLLSKVLGGVNRQCGLEIVLLRAFIDVIVVKIHNNLDGIFLYNGVY
jgi:hypothetical protein